jgi:signal transduction histidine kinase
LFFPVAANNQAVKVKNDRRLKIAKSMSDGMNKALVKQTICMTFKGNNRNDYLPNNFQL